MQVLTPLSLVISIAAVVVCSLVAVPSISVSMYPHVHAALLNHYVEKAAYHT